ncbi:MAG: MBL fold metallo-hydrolase [Planctomycetota bacterium]
MRKYVWLIGLCMFMTVSLLFAQNEPQGKEQKDVFIWCIGNENNAVVVKTPKHLLIFDYCFDPYSKLPEDSEKGILNGGKTIVPKEIANENTFVFITHSHSDHYDPAIQKLAEKAKKIHYIIPDCMKQGFSELTNCTTTMGKNTKELNGLKVHPICSAEGSEGGCCYLIEVDKIIIAYINSCYDVKADPRTFIEELPKLLGKQRIDIAFIDMFMKPASLKFPEEYQPRVIIPVHGDKEHIKITEQFDKESKSVNLKMGEKYIYPMDRKPITQKEVKKPNDKKSGATIRYLGHSGIAIKTSKHFLVFDYANQPTNDDEDTTTEVINPSEINDEDVWIFISHEHQDHFDSNISTWQKDISKIKYIVPPGVANFNNYGNSPPFKDAVNKKNLVVLEPNKELKIEGINILTIRATDSGVGFLVEVDGLVIFHAGDHALWDKKIEKTYQAEIKKVKDTKKTIDIAFLPLQPNHPNRETIREGALWATKELAPRVVVPIHLSGKYEEGETFVESVQNQKLNSQPVLMKDKKKIYLYQDGKIKEE